MEPHQVLPGAANNYKQALSWSIHEGEELLAFASGKNVVVYHGHNFVQVLEGHESDVTIIEWCKAFGKLLTCSHGRLVIYDPFTDEDEPKNKLSTTEKITWKKTGTIDAPDYDFSCAAFNLLGDKILLGGTNLMLYEYITQEERWKLVWGMKTPNPIQIVSFSPDDRFFASVAQHDRFVKIWFRNRHKPDHHDQDTDYSYIYLPRSVKLLEWRQKDILESGFVANVLFTVAADNCVRIWTETNETEELQFHVCSVIKRDIAPMLVQWLHMAHEISPNEVNLRAKYAQLLKEVL
jgi:WD40 repeat protein